MHNTHGEESDAGEGNEEFPNYRLGKFHPGDILGVEDKGEVARMLRHLAHDGAAMLNVSEHPYVDRAVDEQLLDYTDEGQEFRLSMFLQRALASLLAWASFAGYNPELISAAGLEYFEEIEQEALREAREHRAL